MEQAIIESLVEIKLNQTSVATLIAPSRALVRYPLASYYDSFNAIGYYRNLFIRTKKLRHELTLTFKGLDKNKMRFCIQKAVGAGLIAAIIAVYATGGGALSAASVFH